MKGSFTYTLMAQIRRQRFERDREQAAAELEQHQQALAEENAELKRARIMNRVEPGYERKDGKL